MWYKKKNNKTDINNALAFTGALFDSDKKYNFKEKKERKVNLDVLSEDQEQMLLVDWLDYKNIKYTHIPNSTYTISWSVKNRNKRLGVKRGFPDMVICLKNTLVFIELKRSKKSLSKVSDEQKEWIDILNTYPYCLARVCYGFDDAKSFISDIIKAE